jgi:hypothetical protein
LLVGVDWNFLLERERMQRIRLWFLGVLSGYAILLGGISLCWELVKAIDFHSPWTTPNWYFCYPFFLRCVTTEHWTEPWDVGLGIVILGAIVLSISAFSLGHFTKRKNVPF